uniref:WD repeat domain 13 n=1 Tax=Plectus sambesii TaxID=2011161 RepID=A0A914V5Q2_9BILA
MQASSNVWQQVLAVDARYNAHRTLNNPNFRTQYIRRRSQLLRENAKQHYDPSIRQQYLRVRKQLLAQRYGCAPSEGSARSQSLSVRSMSQATLDDQETIRGAGNAPANIVPTSVAEASRALVGDTSIVENYSFAGVHHVFETHTAAITRICFANDERARLAVASLDGKLTICNVAPDANKSSVLLVLTGHSQGVTDFAWSLSNELLVSCSLDCTVRVWDPNSGECVRMIDDIAPVLCCVFEPLNNNLVVTGNERGMIQVLNISTGKQIKSGSCRSNGAALCLCCESNGRILWVGDDKGYIFSFLMDLMSGKLVKGRRILVCQNHPITSLCARAWVSREARDPTLLVSVAANMFCLYRITASDGMLQFKKKFPIRHSSKTMLRSNFCPLMSFRQGACVLSGSEDACVYLFDVERDSKPCVNKLQGHASPVTDVCFNHDESFLASADSQGVVIIWKREHANDPKKPMVPH